MADMVARGMSQNINEQLNKVTTVTDVTNTFTFDLSTSKNFSVTLGDANAKTFTFANYNTPAGFIAQISVLVNATQTPTITYPASVVWQDGVPPTLLQGKKFLLLFTSYDNGTTYLGSYVGAW